LAEADAPLPTDKINDTLFVIIANQLMLLQKTSQVDD